MKILFYCHNLFGLGHVVRSLRIAQAALEMGLDCALMTGCRFLDRLSIEPAIKIERLAPVKMAGGLLVGAEDDDGAVMAKRGRRILEFVRDWKPEAVVSDHIALGLGGELIETLLAAKDEAWPTKFVWGVRDVIRAPGSSSARGGRPKNPGIRRALAGYAGAMAYSELGWIETFAQPADLPLPDRRGYVGVIADRPLPSRPSDRPLIVALAGGGTGGGVLFRLLLAATRKEEIAQEVRIRFVVGPFGRVEEVVGAADLDERFEIWPEGGVEEAVAEASVIVARAGYNTAYHVIQTDRPLILVPLYNEGREQVYRAERLAELSGVWLVDEADPAAGKRLTEAIRAGLARGPVARKLPFGLDGAKRAAKWVVDVATGEGRR